MGEAWVWVDSREYKFVLRHRMASFLSLSLSLSLSVPLFALSLLCLFPTPTANRKGQQLNNAWRHFAGPQISSSARSPRDASSLPPGSLVVPLILRSCTSIPPPQPPQPNTLSWTSENWGHQTCIILVKIGAFVLLRNGNFAALSDTVWSD
jgi:hypothetical protein